MLDREVREAVHVLNREVGEALDHLPLPARVGEALDELHLEVGEALHRLDLEVGEALHDLDLAEELLAFEGASLGDLLIAPRRVVAVIAGRSDGEAGRGEEHGGDPCGRALHGLTPSSSRQRGTRGTSPGSRPGRCP